MLPGGLSVLGLFLIAPPEVSKEAQNTLKKVKRRELTLKVSKSQRNADIIMHSF